MASANAAPVARTEALAATIRERGGQAGVLVLDVTDSKAVARELAALGPILVLVNSAGTKRPALITATPDAHLDLVLDLNFKAAFYLAREVARGCNYDFEQARRATHQLFGRAASRPDAVFVASDHMAFSVMDALRFELGLRVPADVSVVGFDHVPQAAWGSYQLTTIEQPLAPMIEATVALLQRYLAGEDLPPAENVVVPGTLVVRESARRPSAQAARRYCQRNRYFSSRVMPRTTATPRSESSSSRANTPSIWKVELR